MRRTVIQLSKHLEDLWCYGLVRYAVGWGSTMWVVPQLEHAGSTGTHATAAYLGNKALGGGQLWVDRRQMRLRRRTDSTKQRSALQQNTIRSATIASVAFKFSVDTNAYVFKITRRILKISWKICGVLGESKTDSGSFWGGGYSRW